MTLHTSSDSLTLMFRGTRVCHCEQGVAEAWLCLRKGAYRHHSLESDREGHGLERTQYQAEELDPSKKLVWTPWQWLLTRENSRHAGEGLAATMRGGGGWTGLAKGSNPLLCNWSQVTGQFTTIIIFRISVFSVVHSLKAGALPHTFLCSQHLAQYLVGYSFLNSIC